MNRLYQFSAVATIFAAAIAGVQLFQNVQNGSRESPESNSGSISRTPNLGVSIDQGSSRVRFDRISVGGYDAYRARLQAKPFSFRIPNDATGEVGDDRGILVHTSLNTQLMSVDIARRCAVCSTDRYWPQSNFGVADTRAGLGFLRINEWLAPELQTGDSVVPVIPSIDVFIPPRAEDMGSYIKIFVDQIINRGDDTDYLSSGSRLFIVMFDPDNFWADDSMPTDNGFERIVIDFI